MSKKQQPARLLARIRREQETLQLAHAARDLYRKRVSELHPDREPDPAMRAVKTGLMQKANHAHDHNDVFALLSLQAQAGALGVKSLGGLMPECIRYFNKLLTGQLVELKRQMVAMEGSVWVSWACHRKPVATLTSARPWSSRRCGAWWLAPWASPAL